MYEEKGEIMFSPYYYQRCFSQQIEGEHHHSYSPNVPFGSLVQTSTISDYDLGGEGDLFKAPEPIIEEPTMSIDPMTAAISMISCGENISSALEVANLDSIQDEQLFYECKNDMLAKDAIETPLSEMYDIKLPIVGEIDGSIPEDEEVFSKDLLSKSVSSGCLSALERGHRAETMPTFLDFHCDDLETVNGMRRAFSEGDIKNFANNNVNLVPPHGLPQFHGTCSNEDRLQKLSRYRDKKSKRNFGRKIKYACRKALADSQPRVRGRFAKTEDSK